MLRIPSSLRRGVTSQLGMVNKKAISLPMQQLQRTLSSINHDVFHPTDQVISILQNLIVQLFIH